MWLSLGLGKWDLERIILQRKEACTIRSQGMRVWTSSRSLNAGLKVNCQVRLGDGDGGFCVCNELLHPKPREEDDPDAFIFVDVHTPVRYSSSIKMSEYEEQEQAIVMVPFS
ncbi:hypothetical protein TESG_04465 [Trichophyton tonsurans CBS 112818]|uniref:Uncharacterized protein n=1 Tax=Trichophyton tonsurans (strain CBS 112818) TaxID=647933 RepID=F2S0E5_TRIT1|nr:hypothetical protein TESG_04465 [Trichophyton tonsurans CBS 112818]